VRLPRPRAAGRGRAVDGPRPGRAGVPGRSRGAREPPDRGGTDGRGRTGAHPPPHRPGAAGRAGGRRRSAAKGAVVNALQAWFLTVLVHGTLLVVVVGA